MKSLRTIFLSIILFSLCVYCLSTLGTKIYINNYGELLDEDVQKLSQLSVEVGLIESQMDSFENTKEIQQTDVSLVKEYIAEFLDSRSTIQQFVDFLKQAYRGGDIILMAFPYALYDTLGFFVQIYRVIFIAIITISVYVAIRGGDAVNG